MSWPPTVRIALASRADNVALIRELLTGLGESIIVDDALDDIKTAVSEAANNVVMHAYDGREGPLEVEIRRLANELEVVVTDHGKGIASRELAELAASDRMAELGPGHGLGLAVIGALASTLELSQRDPSGLRVVMRFALPTLAGASAGTAAGAGEWEWPAPPDGAVQLTLAPPTLAALVLARVVCATAARSGFSIDRLSDAQLVADALAAQLEPALSGGALALALEGKPRRLELELGPFRPGGARGALAGSSLGALGVVERLADQVEVLDGPAGERLRVVLVDQRRG